MPRIRCHYDDCIFLDDGYCTTERIELDPETGCLTFQRVDEAEATEVSWEAEEEELEEEDVFEEEEEVEWDEDEDEEDDDEDDEW